jgi:2-polyprenyl-6-methoxyphenol hydroxylase-like FAD-dependent oxidoreductase
LQSRYDVVVVGARCAGAATAMSLARKGLAVLLLDRAGEGTDTLSTHALMRAGVLQLHHWGLLDRVRRRGTPVVRSTSFHYADDVVAIDLKPRDGIDGLYAPRRLVIDALLVEAAREAQVEVVHKIEVIDLIRASEGRVAGVVVKDADGRTAEVAADLVIGADGMRSRVAALVEATPYRTGRHATAVIFSYFADVGLDGYHWYFRPRVSAGVIPTNDGLTCVFVAMPPERFHDELRHDLAAGHRRVLNECDATLASVVKEDKRAERYRAFPGAVGYFRRSWGPGWALVGDAAYFKDPLTAHGMTDALVDAEVLARAVADRAEHALDAYERARDVRALSFFEATDAIASFAWDMPTVQGLHHAISDAMKREAASVVAMYSRP